MSSSESLPKADAPLDAVDNPALVKRKIRLAPRVGLSTLLLATACFAAWWSYSANERAAASLRDRLVTVRMLARELDIKDRSKIVAVMLDPTNFDEQSWNVYVPSDACELRLATRDIPDIRGQTVDPTQAVKTVHSAPLAGGQHRIEFVQRLDQKEWLLEVLVDNNVVIAAREPQDWRLKGGSASRRLGTKQVEQPPGKPVVLLQRLFSKRDDKSAGNVTSNGNGILLWIE